MRKFIALKVETYDELEKLREKRETFNEVVARLIDIRRMIMGIEPILAGQKAFQEFKSARQAQKEATNR